MPERPSVSVCIPTFNGARWLRRCLDSALRQTHRDFELLIADDCSTDATWDIARAYGARDARVRLVRNPRRLGLVGNWNRCVELARGEWVKFLFQDDLLAPRCLESMLDAAGPRALLVVCRRRARFEPGTPRRVREVYRRHFAEHSVPRRFPGAGSVGSARFAGLVLRSPGVNIIGEPTAVLARREAFARFGRFDPDLVSLCDWEFFARVAVNAGLSYTDEPLALFRVHPAAESAENLRRRRFRTEVLDDLLMRRRIAHEPAYAPVRAAARREGPTAALDQSLLRAVHAARRQAALYARDRRTPDRNARSAWRWALRRHPVLAELAGRALPAEGTRPAPARLHRAALELLAEAGA